MENVKSAIQDIATSELIDHLKHDGQQLDLAVIEELSRRPEAVAALKEIIEANASGSGNWPVIHAVHVLSLIKTPESLNALIFTASQRHRELSDFLDQTMPGLLAGFGPKALKKLERSATHEHLNFYARGTIITAIAAIAWKYPETRQKTILFLKNVVETNGNKDAVTHAIFALGKLHEKSAVPCIMKAFEEKRVDPEFIDEQTAVGLAAGIEQLENLKQVFEMPITYFAQRSHV